MIKIRFKYILDGEKKTVTLAGRGHKMSDMFAKFAREYQWDRITSIMRVNDEGKKVKMQCLR